MQKAIDAVITRLLEDGHIEKVDEIKDVVFIQAMVISLKKDRLVKIAIPNLKKLMDMIVERLDSAKGEVWYSSVDLSYAHRQVPLHALTARHCIFQSIGGESTCTYRFVTGFYGLTILPTEFQKVMGNLLARFRELFVFLDNILIVLKEQRASICRKCGKYSIH